MALLLSFHSNSKQLAQLELAELGHQIYPNNIVVLCHVSIYFLFNYCGLVLNYTNNVLTERCINPSDQIKQVKHIKCFPLKFKKSKQ